MKHHAITPFYRSRSDYLYFDDTSSEDEWQLEVYQYAAALMHENGMRSVIDVGCGSAYKLVKYLGQYETLGLDVAPTVKWLRARHPDRRWLECDFHMHEEMAADLVVCADVVEHLPDPDVLLQFIKGMEFRLCVLSTPARNLMYRCWERKYWGPPVNPHHIREWTRREFRSYVSRYLRVVNHFISNPSQWTQMLVCVKQNQ